MLLQILQCSLYRFIVISFVSKISIAQKKSSDALYSTQFYCSVFVCSWSDVATRAYSLTTVNTGEILQLLRSASQNSELHLSIIRGTTVEMELAIATVRKRVSSVVTSEPLLRDVAHSKIAFSALETQTGSRVLTSDEVSQA